MNDSNVVSAQGRAFLWEQGKHLPEELLMLMQANDKNTVFILPVQSQYASSGISKLYDLCISKKYSDKTVYRNSLDII